MNKILLNINSERIKVSADSLKNFQMKQMMKRTFINNIKSNKNNQTLINWLQINNKIKMMQNY